jgi:hypothetical protein
LGTEVLEFSHKLCRSKSWKVSNERCWNCFA